jgi:hypothetical protein
MTSTRGNPPPPTTPTTPVTQTTTIQLTFTDFGHTVPVAIGQSVEVTLATPGRLWADLTVTPAGLLRPDPSPSPPSGGQLGIWTAAVAGTVTVSSTGTAVCAREIACPANILNFTVTLVIG